MITDRISAHDVSAGDVLDLIATRQRELNELEYKQQSGEAELQKAACAIANSGGGFIIVGMAEDADHCASAIVDVERPQAVADSIRQSLRDGISPRPSLEVLPLQILDDHVIIIRVAPQNPPHMVIANKRTDFYGRYDATSERMRYEEIEQRFRDKFRQGQPSEPATPRAALETLSGRRDVAAGTVEILSQYIKTFMNSGQPSLGLLAVQDGIREPVSSDMADWFFSDPSYARTAGWLSVHPSLPITTLSGRWQQDYGEVSRTYINASGDLVFQKAIDEVLCWRQNEADFNRCPRLYSNALIEYCLSFVYSLADLVALTKPRAFIVTAVLVVGPNGAQLPLGEGGTVWFDAPPKAPAVLKSTLAVTPMWLETIGPIHVRRQAFKLAEQIYALFGYSKSQVAFADQDLITFEAETEQSAAAALCSYLRGRFGAKVHYGGEEFTRSIHWFNLKPRGSGDSVVVAFSNEFFREFAMDENSLFKRLDAEDLETALNVASSIRLPLITTDGIRFLDGLN